MYQKVKAYVKKWHMLQKEDSVIAGISGGADSVCLLFMLLKLQKELGFALMAVHVNHGIRGAEAERDEAYVKRLCRQWNVRLKVYRENVPAYAKEHGMTEEEAGRDIRRTCFCKVLKEWGGTKIALAHHTEPGSPDKQPFVAVDIKSLLFAQSIFAAQQSNFFCCQF